MSRHAARRVSLPQWLWTGIGAHVGICVAGWVLALVAVLGGVFVTEPLPKM
jgi:hypothetical protein